MRFRVVLQASAEMEAEAAYGWIRSYAPDAAERWLDALGLALDSLVDFPERCALAPEADAFDEPVRQLLFGRRRGVYKILFAVRGEVVHVLAIRHGARERLTPEDLTARD